jgi:hypothetical protein
VNPEFKQAADLVRRAVTEEVISVTPRAIRKWRGWDTRMLQATMDNVAADWKRKIDKSPWLGQQSSWQLPTTRRYQQSRMPRGAPLVQPLTGRDWMVEVARWPVPAGSVGIIKSFEQFFSRVQLGGEAVYTTSEHWGNPYPTYPDSLGVRWYFRLSPLHLVAGPWRNASGFSAIPEYLPGIPYDDFPWTDDLWFPAAASSSANIHLPIPGAHFLRVVCIVAGSQSQARISAKLSGTIQTELSRDAQFTLRTSW